MSTVSLWDDEKVLEMQFHSTVDVFNPNEMVKMVNFTFCVFYHTYTYKWT